MSLQVWLPLNGNLRNNGCNPANTVQSTAPTYVNGKLGKAMASGAFYLPAADVAKFYNNKAMSFAFWIYPFGSSSSGQVIIGQNNTSAGDNRMFSIFQYPTPVDIHLSWQSETSQGSFISAVFSNVLTASTWNHVAVTYNGSTATLYVNGTQTGISNGTSTRTNFSYNVPIPNNTTTRYLSDIRIYDHCLSVTEVKELAKGLVCHYKLSSDGNENLLKYTHVNETNKNLLKANMSSNWNNLPITTIDGHECYQYPTAQSPTWFSSGGWFGPMEANTTYTYTAWIYFTANANFNFTSLGHFQVYNSNSTASDKSHEDVVASRIYEPSTIKANTWAKVRITFTTNNLAGSYFQIYPRYNIAANTGELYFRDCKLEKNGSPTEWVPNSADVEYNGMGYNSTIVSDCSGYGYNGTKSGTLSRDNDSPRYDSSTTFSSGSHINTTLVTGGFTNTYTFSWWGKYTNYQSHMMWGFSDGNKLNLYMASGNFYWNTGDGTNNPFGVSVATYGDGKWHHFAVTGDGTTSKLYIDGVFKANATTYRGITGTTIYMNGWDSSTNYNFNGSLSDFRLYATTLSADDIKALYNIGARIAKNGSMLSYEVKEVE